MQKGHALCLAALALLLTGCPYNEYTIELTPRGKVVERKLTFYRADGTTTNGTPNYQSFSRDELRTIRRFYPRDAVKKESQVYIATSEFLEALPNDVGGAGSYTTLSNCLGAAGFYMERFRGNDDIAARVQAHLKAADKLVDYIIGWSRKEFGGERHYEELRRFLDGNFRQDVRNLSIHGWVVGTSVTTGAPTPEEFAIRFAQYLSERGYFRMDEFPELARSFTTGDDKPLLLRLQQLMAQKLKFSPSKPLPQSLAFVAEPEKLAQSWEDYLATTTEYRVKLRHWQMKKVSAEVEIIGQKFAGYFRPASSTNKPAAPTVPDKPQPAEVANELVGQFLEITFWGTDDHLSVKLRLPAAPTHTNGKWDEAAKQVTWEAYLSDRKDPISVPAFCYATWAQSDDAFQTTHFGKVVLKGDNLLQYCLWRGGLEPKRATEWDAFLVGLRPVESLADTVSGFRFADWHPPAPTNSQSASTNPIDFPAQLFKSALEK
jgi:hypothetical protein